MTTYNQSSRKHGRLSKPKCIKAKKLLGCPQRKGTCTRVFIIKPKKPNSAQRKLAKVKLNKNRYVLAAIPGQQHNLQEFSSVLVRGGRARDLPGVRYKLIRGVCDLDTNERILRQHKRSKYGIQLLKRNKQRRRKPL